MVLQWKICETVFTVGLTTVFFYTVAAVCSPATGCLGVYLQTCHATLNLNIYFVTHTEVFGLIKFNNGGNTRKVG